MEIICIWLEYLKLYDCANKLFYPLWVFQTSVYGWSFNGIWVTASLFKFLEYSNWWSQAFFCLLFFSFSKSFGTVPSEPSTISITVTFIFSWFFSSSVRIKYLFLFNFFHFHSMISKIHLVTGCFFLVN